VGRGGTETEGSLGVAFAWWVLGTTLAIITAGVRADVEGAAQVRGILRSRGFEPRLLRRGGCDTSGMGGGGGGTEGKKKSSE